MRRGRAQSCASGSRRPSGRMMATYEYTSTASRPSKATASTSSEAGCSEALRFRTICQRSLRRTMSETARRADRTCIFRSRMRKAARLCSAASPAREGRSSTTSRRGRIRRGRRWSPSRSRSSRGRRRLSSVQTASLPPAFPQGRLCATRRFRFPVRYRLTVRRRGRYAAQKAGRYAALR